MRTIRKEAGFSVVELMVTMVVFLFVMVAASQIFSGLLNQFKQQSRVTETNIEGAIGLDILRRDLEQAGFGLPWNVTGTVSTWATITGYYEAASTGTDPDPVTFNDGDADTGTGGSAPKAVWAANDLTVSGYNGSDYLVIKGMSVANNYTAGKWQPVHPRTDVSDNATYKTWWRNAAGTADTADNVSKTDTGADNTAARVVVVSPGFSSSNSRSLVTSTGGSYYLQVNDYATLANFAPSPGDTEVRVMYGVDPGVDLRMPFNRADYYVKRPPSRPAKCAVNTGTLYKATVSHSNGSLTAVPLLDCVANMQVVFRLDMDGDGVVGTSSNADGTSITTSETKIGGAAYTATDVGGTSGTGGVLHDATLLRQSLKEVRVYVLAHEGQLDRSFTFSTNHVTVGEFGLGTDFVFGDYGITDWQHYRWKVYTIVMKPKDLM